MRKTIAISLLLAGLVLAGCQKGNTVKYGSPVRFTASSTLPSTRTAYSGVVTGGIERINWLEGEELLIWSDNAVDRDSDAKYSVYQIVSPSGSGAKSTATLKNPEGENGLVYTDATTYSFWGVSPVISGAPTAGTASYTIPAAQQMPSTETASTANGVTTIPADMANAYLLSAYEGAKEDEKITMDFYPGFTAFELTLTADPEFDGDITIEKVELLSESGLAGSVVATLVPGTETNTVDGTAHTVGAHTYVCTSAGSATYTLPDDTTVDKDTKVTFTVFALPQNIVGLQLKIYVEVDGETTSFTGTLKKNGNPITFGMCEKHRIKGVAIPGNLWKIYYQPGIVTADEWVPAGTATNLIVE